jgi:hypothetical protein
MSLLRVKLCARWHQNFQWKGPIPIPRGAGRSTKSEIRNPKVPNCNVFSWFAVFEHSNFEFVSDFDIRISNFPKLRTWLVPAMPG